MNKKFLKNVNPSKLAYHFTSLKKAKRAAQNAETFADLKKQNSNYAYQENCVSLIINHINKNWKDFSPTHMEKFIAIGNEISLSFPKIINIKFATFQAWSESAYAYDVL